MWDWGKFVPWLGSSAGMEILDRNLSPVGKARIYPRGEICPRRRGLYMRRYTEGYWELSWRVYMKRYT